jgi:hypothetical protein
MYAPSAARSFTCSVSRLKSGPPDRSDNLELARQAGIV